MPRMMRCSLRNPTATRPVREAAPTEDPPRVAPNIPKNPSLVTREHTLDRLQDPDHHPLQVLLLHSRQSFLCRHGRQVRLYPQRQHQLSHLLLCGLQVQVRVILDFTAYQD